MVGGSLVAGALTACSSHPARPVPGTSSAELLTLRHWYHQYGESGTEQAVRRYAKAYDKANVTIQWTRGDYDKLIAAALSAGAGPDVFEAPNGPTIDQIQGGQVLPVEPLSADVAIDFTTSLLDRMSYGGRLYAIPQVVDTQLLVYRKSLLRESNVRPPQTFGELAAAARKLTTNKVKGLFVGNDAGVAALAGPMLWSAGADYLTADNRVGFDTPLVATALGNLRDLFTSGALLMGAAGDWANPAALAEGRTAMQWTGLWTFPALQQAFGDDFGVLPWPRFSATAGRPSIPIGAYGAAINAKTKSPDAARAYLKWLWIDQQDSQLDFAQSYGFHIPSRRTLADRAEKLKSGAAADAVKLVRAYGKAQSPLLWTPAADAALKQAMARIVRDGADPTMQLQKARTVVEAELRRVLK
jgi:multiple sugar transport system substrate-binding protein